MRRQILIIISTGLITLVISCKKTSHSDTGDPPVPISEYTVRKTSVVFYDNYPGTVTALKEVGLRGEVTGYLTGIFFREGSHVTQGSQLYEIDRRQYEAAFKEANDNLHIAEQNLARVQLDVDRYSKLKNQEAIAQQRYDYALTDLANAKLQIAVATEEQVKAKTNLDFSLIAAPFEGTIGLSQVKVGDLITPGQTLLNTISSDDPIGFDFVIAQSELSKFRQLQQTKTSANDSTFRLILPDNSIYAASGRIDVIDRAVDPQTGTIRIRLVFSNPNRELRPGMNCTIRVSQASNEPLVMIPFKAVLEQMGEYFIFRVTDNKVKEVKVSLGPRVNSEVVIKDGIQQGDVIAVDGIEKLTDNVSVTIGSPDSQKGKMNAKWK